MKNPRDRSIAVLVGLLLVFVSAAVSVHAAAPVAPSSVGFAGAQAAADAPPPQQAGDVVLRSESRRDYVHVFLAFGVAWLLILGYIVSVSRRFARLEEEVRRLQGVS